MQLNAPLACNLAYCTNVFTGESWEEIFQNIQSYLIPIQQRFSPQAAFGLGLHFSYQATEELRKPLTLEQFKHWLEEKNCYVFTMNACTYGDFHQKIVKQAVFEPDWASPQRLAYTENTIDLLAALLPHHIQTGSISTIPLGYKPAISKEKRPKFLSECAKNLAELVFRMHKIKVKQNKHILLNLEPEPDCLLETFLEFFDFYQDYLLPIGASVLQKKLKCDLKTACQTIYQHIGLCYDICHFSVAYEDPELIFKKLSETPIRIGKIQLSAALKVDIPQSVSARLKLKQDLLAFCEQTYLHQIVARTQENTLVRYSDLPLGIETLENTNEVEWRIHYHVPLFQENFSLFGSTQADVLKVLRLLKTYPVCQHLEIETYTWSVLPKQYQGNLSQSIAREYEWVFNTTHLEINSVV